MKTTADRIANLERRRDMSPGRRIRINLLKQAGSRRTFTEEEVAAMKQSFREGMTVAEAVVIYGRAASTLRAIKHGWTWGWVR